MAILIGVWESILVLVIVVFLTMLALWCYWRRRLVTLRQELGRQRQRELDDLRQELNRQHQTERDDLRRELNKQHQTELDDLRHELNRQHQAELDALRQGHDRQRQTEIRDMIREFKHQASHFLGLINYRLHQIKNEMQVQTVTNATEWPQLLGRSLQDIEKYEWRLTRLIENLAFVSRLEAPDYSLRFSEVKPDVIVSDVVSEFNDWAEAKEMRLAWWAVPERFPRIMANEEGLRQVFINLIDNAIKYCREGDEIDVALEANEDKNVILAQVSDTGPGIPEEDWELIFQKEYTVERARGRKPKEGSQGLGLYIAKLVVEKHGGTVEVTGKLGKGTTFTITLPIQRI